MKKNWLVKTVSLALAGIMMLGIVGCGNTEEKESSVQKSEEKKSSQVVQQSSTQEEEVFEVSYPLDTDATFKYLITDSMKYDASYTSFDESPFHQGLEKKTGVDVMWDVVSYDNLELTLAEPKDRPDAFSRGWVGGDILSQWIVDDVIVDLTDYLPTYAPDFWEFINRPENETTKRTVTDENGRFWYIPGVIETENDITYKGFVIRQDWLDECGLDMPVTLEDVEEVLVAFKEKYGATFIGTYNYFCEYGFASGVDAQSSMWPRLYVDDNGKVQHACAQPEYKKLMEIYAKWWDMGLFDEDFITADNALARQKALEGKTGIVYVPQSQMTLYLQDAEANNTGAEWVAMPHARTAEGAPTKCIQTGASKFTNVHYSFITTNCDEELIPIILAWFNYGFTEEGSMYFNFGEEGVTYTLDANGNVQWTDLIAKDPLGVAGVLPRYAVWHNTAFGIQLHKFKEAFNDPRVVEANKVWTENTVASKYFLPSLTISEEDSVTYADKITAVNTYAEQMGIKFLTGEASLDDWDAYIEELNKLGLQEALSIQQAAYDKFVSK